MNLSSGLVGKIIRKRSVRTDFSIKDMPSLKKGERVLFVVSHPDDEWLSCAGLLQRAIKAEAKIKIIVATMGEWSKTYSYLDNGHMKSFFSSLGAKRAKETLAAIKLIGVNEKDVVFLGYPGGHLQTLLKKNWSLPFFTNYLESDRVVFDFAFEFGAVFSGEKVLQLIKKITQEFRPDIVVTHSPFDTHKDHKTVYWLVKACLSELTSSAKTYFFLVHYRGFSFSGKNSLDHYLEPPKKFINGNLSWYSSWLEKSEQKIKKRGMLKYKTQLKNPYLNILLKSFCRQNELFYEEKT